MVVEQSSSCRPSTHSIDMFFRLGVFLCSRVWASSRSSSSTTNQSPVDTRRNGESSTKLTINGRRRKKLEPDFSRVCSTFNFCLKEEEDAHAWRPSYSCSDWLTTRSIHSIVRCVMMSKKVWKRMDQWVKLPSSSSGRRRRNQLMGRLAAATIWIAFFFFSDIVATWRNDVLAHRRIPAKAQGQCPCFRPIFAATAFHLGLILAHSSFSTLFIACPVLFWLRDCPRFYTKKAFQLCWFFARLCF